ncbi:MAG: type II toxin-antitoxin system prevent-host-death family antitoxin, partial [Chloroflexota bacterium]
MRIMGVRDLKARLSEALEAVEGGEVIEVTNHGRTVARIVPTNRQPSPQEVADALDSIDRMAEEIGKYAPA